MRLSPAELIRACRLSLSIVRKKPMNELTDAEAIEVLRGASKAHVARLPSYMKRAYVRLFGEGCE